MNISSDVSGAESRAQVITDAMCDEAVAVFNEVSRNPQGWPRTRELARQFVCLNISINVLTLAQRFGQPSEFYRRCSTAGRTSPSRACSAAARGQLFVQHGMRTVAE